MPSNLSPDCLPAGQSALQAEVFRLPEEEFHADLLAEKVTADLGRLLGFGEGDILHRGHVVVPHAYVVSDHRRAPAVRAILAWLEERGIRSMGLYGRWKYVWSDEAFRQGRDTALALRGAGRPGGDEPAPPDASVPPGDRHLDQGVRHPAAA